MGDLAAQHSQLVAQHEDLCVLGEGVHPVDPEHLDDASDQAVEEAEGHGAGASSSGASFLVKPRDRANGPFSHDGVLSGP